MGMSTPTTTEALDAFMHRYAAFRAELHPREQAWFDELVCRARRHASAINRRPHLDFERPVILAMLMEGMREVEEVRRAMEATRRQLEEACKALAEAGLMRRATRRSFAEMAHGQVRLGQGFGVGRPTRAVSWVAPGAPSGAVQE